MRREADWRFDLELGQVQVDLGVADFGQPGKLVGRQAYGIVTTVAFLVLA